MKKTLLPILLAAVFLAPSLTAHSQAINTTDSLALVDLYNSTNGPAWTNHTNWLTSQPVTSWYGITSYDVGRVNIIVLNGNNLSGSLPASIGNLTDLGALLAWNNNLTGTLPASMTNFTNDADVELQYNHLSGPIPNFSQTDVIYLSYNNYTFADLEPYNMTNVRTNCYPQADLPLLQNGNLLSIAAGGTVANNTYKWYKDGAVVATIQGDSTYNSTTPGNYSVTVTNYYARLDTLNSIQTTNTQDSLALVDLYNNTAGANWLLNSGWLTTKPVSSWRNVVTRHGRVAELYLPGNNLSGTLPFSFGNLTAATSLNLSNNKIGGNLPTSLGNLASILSLSLTQNAFTGPIPTSLGALSQVQDLEFGLNQLTGNIPPVLGSLTSLTNLYLSGNQLTDTIPSSFWNLTNLSAILLDNNKLTGRISASIGRMQNVVNINLNDNQFTGSIPDSICYIPRLAHLELYNNQFTGKLPDSLGNATELLDIDVQNNLLTGLVPPNLSSLYLDIVNISNNRYTFSAMLPSLPSFTTFTYAPQANIPLIRTEDKLSVSAGGPTASSTFTLFKDGVSIATQTGDSVFAITGLGNYNIVTTNTVAPLLTLYSDTLKLGLVLPDSAISIQQAVGGDTATNFDTNIFRLITLTPVTGPNALNSNTTAAVTVDNQVSTFNGQPYVQRHYAITPADNASTAEATVILYFTQADFDAFNTYVTANSLSMPLLPTNGVDNGNLRITQYHGTFAGTDNPANYSQGSLTIVPTVAWDATDNWWTVTFPIIGFSGFYLSSGSIPLPLTLLQFNGVLQNNAVHLSWTTTNQQNTASFAIERSADSLAFTAIGDVSANGVSGKQQYAFTDDKPQAGRNAYRLKMIDQDGHYTYSPIVSVSWDPLSAAASVYPNPAKQSATILFNAGTAGKYSIQLTDMAGRKLRLITGETVAGVNKVDIDLSSLASGSYLITVFDEEYQRRDLMLNKQ